MGRHKQPREVAELKGATKVNPERYRNEVPKSTAPFGKYPSKRTKVPAECWAEIANECIPGVLTGADRFMVEIAADLLAEYRTDPPGFAVGKYRTLVGLFGRFGMSPSDRSRLGVVPPDPDEFVFKDL
jgi:hypothetical protein